jgi:hypothetical protein
LLSDIGESEVEGGLRNLVSRVKALVYLMADDYLLALREYGEHIKYNNNNSTVWTETHTLKVCLVAWLLLRLKQPQQLNRLVMLQQQIYTGVAYY